MKRSSQRFRVYPLLRTAACSERVDLSYGGAVHEHSAIIAEIRGGSRSLPALLSFLRADGHPEHNDVFSLCDTESLQRCLLLLLGRVA